jgi:AcrR family transcriptional regulator
VFGEVRIVTQGPSSDRRADVAGERDPQAARLRCTAMARTDTRRQILDATFDALADVGLGGLSLEDVAIRGGVSRQTLYRHFGNRGKLIQATIEREEARLLAVVADAAAPHEDLSAALFAALRSLLRWTAEHELLGTLLATEPEALLPLLASGDAPVLAAARPAIAEVLAPRVPAGADTETAADMLARVMLSYAINPPAGDADDVARQLTRLLVEGLGARLTADLG